MEDGEWKVEKDQRPKLSNPPSGEGRTIWDLRVIGYNWSRKTINGPYDFH